MAGTCAFLGNYFSSKISDLFFQDFSKYFYFTNLSKCLMVFVENLQGVFYLKAVPLLAFFILDCPFYTFLQELVCWEAKKSVEIL